MTRRDEIDEAVRNRIAEISSAAGVPHSRASLEVLYYLPRDFLQRYTELFSAALKLDNGGGEGRSPDEEPSAVSNSFRGKRPMVGAGGKRYKEHWVVISDDALDMKRRVDKRLRSLAREILEELHDSEGGKDGRTRERCVRCGRIFGKSWNFCANCGNHRPIGNE